jgi:hypothetical protein
MTTTSTQIIAGGSDSFVAAKVAGAAETVAEHARIAGAMTTVNRACP